MDTSQLGFHNLPFLAHRKSVKKGFEFTLMVVGKCKFHLGLRSDQLERFKVTVMCCDCHFL